MKKKIIIAVLAASLCVAVATPIFTMTAYADETIIIPPTLPDPDEPENNVTYEPVVEPEKPENKTEYETIIENWVASDYVIETTVEDVIVSDSTTIETVYEDLVASDYVIKTTVEDVIVSDSATTETVYEDWVASDYTVTYETVYEDAVVEDSTIETEENEISLLLGDWGKEDVWEIAPDDNNENVEEGKCNHDSSSTCSNCYKKEVVWENETEENEISLLLGDWGKEDIWEIAPDDNNENVEEGKCNHDSSSTCSNCYKKEVVWEN